MFAILFSKEATATILPKIILPGLETTTPEISPIEPFFLIAVNVFKLFPKANHSMGTVSTNCVQ